MVNDLGNKNIFSHEGVNPDKTSTLSLRDFKYKVRDDQVLAGTGPRKNRLSTEHGT